MAAEQTPSASLGTQKLDLYVQGNVVNDIVHKRSPSVPRMWTGGRARFLEAALGLDIQRVDESAVSGALMI